MNIGLVPVNLLCRQMAEYNFRDEVHELVGRIPKGRVMTYGDVAIRCGSPRSARIVGTIAHYGPVELPWQRLVNRYGGLGSGYWGGKEQQRADLEAEGVRVSEDFIVIDFEKLRWTPGRLS